MKRNLVSLSLLLLLPVFINASPVTAQLSNEQVRQAVVNEVINTVFSVIKRSKPGAAQLQSALTNNLASTSREIRINHDEENLGTPNTSSNSTPPQDQPYLELPLPIKEAFVHELPFEMKEYIFDELGEKLLDTSNPRPFNIPSLGICQWDTFVLMMHVLLEGESRFDQLVTALDSCYGLPTHKLWKLQPMLNKEPILKVIPINFQHKFFTKDPKKLAGIVYRIQGLINIK